MTMGKHAQEQPHDDNAVRRVAGKFCSALPREAVRDGRWQPPDQSWWSSWWTGGERLPVRDGIYRVDYGEWAFKFAGGRLAEAIRCIPPDFGGPDVRQIISTPR
jgi:hypothetical protein